MKRPVFVVGCPRSGTTLLYSMLVAAGGFAFYRKETYFYDLVVEISASDIRPIAAAVPGSVSRGLSGEGAGLGCGADCAKGDHTVQDDERVPSAADDRDRRTTRHGAVDRGNTRARPVHGPDRAGRPGRTVRARHPRRPRLRTVDRSSGLGALAAMGRAASCRRGGLVLGVDGQIGPSVRTSVSTARIWRFGSSS